MVVRFTKAQVDEVYMHLSAMMGIGDGTRVMAGAMEALEGATPVLTRAQQDAITGAVALADTEWEDEPSLAPQRRALDNAYDKIRRVMKP